MPMTIGDYTLTHYPSAFTLPRQFRSNSHVETYGGVEHFSWGFYLVGKIIEITWSYMPSTQFDALDAEWQEDEQMIWDPGIPGSSDTYDVEILDFTGDFHETVGTGAEIWRANCKMTLLIMGLNAGS